jgi:TBC1 domain family protein 5
VIFSRSGYGVSVRVDTIRLGMHEILAPLYYAVDYDSIQENGTSGIHDMEQICSSSWVAADAWALFDKVMRGLSKCYEWREPPLNLSPRGNLPSFTSHVNISARANPLEIKAYVAPIVGICNRMQAELLQAVDPVLFRHMQATGIEPQIYGM